MHPFFHEACKLFVVALIGALSASGLVAKEPSKKRPLPPIKLNQYGIPPYGSPWTVHYCPKQRRCEVDVKIEVDSAGQCIFTVPDVIDAYPGETKVVRWNIKSAHAGYRVGFERLDFDPPGDADVEPDPASTDDDDHRHKRYRNKTLSFLTYNIYAWYKPRIGVRTPCPNNPHGPAITNRG